MDFKIIFVNPMTVVINLLLLSTVTDAICILPPELRNTEWIYKYTKPDDNQPITTTLRIQNTILPQQSSVRFNALGTTMDAWTCISNLTLSDTESVAVFKSDTSYSDGPFGDNRWLYLCMKFTKVTDNLFYFYLLSDVDNTILPNERAFNPPGNSIPDDSDPLCSTFCQYTSEPKIRTLQKTGTTDVVPSDAALCTPCESPCEEPYSTVAGHAFTATLPLGYTPVSIGSPIKYTLINSASIGSEYNADTGIYTVAKPGIYYISVSMMSGLQTASHLTIRKNADVLVWLYTNNDYGMASQTININLAANDKISVVVNSGSSLYSVYNTFSVLGPIE